MNTMVTIVCRPSGAAQVAVPAVALFDDGDRTCVWICREDSTVVSREVRVERLQTGGTCGRRADRHVGRAPAA